MAKKVAILGGTGMLGAMMTRVMSEQSNLDVWATRRPGNSPTPSLLEWRNLDAAHAQVTDCRHAIAGARWVINCIGITKPYVEETDGGKIERAIRVNASFPHLLAEAAQLEEARVLQIATDCVFSGTTGNYVESDIHDANDVYGKTKSLGEVFSENVHHLRYSIIDPEFKGHKFLLDWFLAQPTSSRLNGFTNHMWNGITTLHFAHVIAGIVRTDRALPRLQHLVPAGRVNKAELLEMFAHFYRRGDIQINKVHARPSVDRTLITSNAELNAALWSTAGYATPPTLQEMVKELAQYPAFYEAGEHKVYG